LTFYCVFSVAQRPAPHSFPTRRSSDLFLPPTLMMTLRPTLPGLTRPFTRALPPRTTLAFGSFALVLDFTRIRLAPVSRSAPPGRSEEHTSELQSRENLVCRLLLEKKKQ